jgi:hypothetical protein
MLNANPETERPESDDAAVERIAQSGARGALALVTIATAVVLGTWLAFYLLVFLPRGVAP